MYPRTCYKYPPSSRTSFRPTDTPECLQTVPDRLQAVRTRSMQFLSVTVTDTDTQPVTDGPFCVPHALCIQRFHSVHTQSPGGFGRDRLIHLGVSPTARGVGCGLRFRVYSHLPPYPTVQECGQTLSPSQQNRRKIASIGKEISRTLRGGAITPRLSVGHIPKLWAYIFPIAIEEMGDCVYTKREFYVRYAVARSAQQWSTAVSLHSSR